MLGATYDKPACTTTSLWARVHDSPMRHTPPEARAGPYPGRVSDTAGTARRRCRPFDRERSRNAQCVLPEDQPPRATTDGG